MQGEWWRIFSFNIQVFDNEVVATSTDQVHAINLEEPNWEIAFLSVWWGKNDVHNNHLGHWYAWN